MTSKRTSASPKRSRRRPRRTPPQRTALEAFARLTKTLRLRWYVFGAQAVALHGFPRATADLDVTVDLGEHSPQAFIKVLSASGFTPRFRDPEFVRTTRVIPIVHTATGLPMDVVLAGPGLEQLFLDAAEPHRVGRTTVPVISREHLIVTKILAGRPKDLEDVRELLARGGTQVDLAVVEELLAALEEALGQADLRPRLAALRAR